MKSPPSCPLCSDDVNSLPIRRNDLLVYCCGNCGLHFGETDQVSATLAPGAVDTDPHHFSTLLTRSDELGAALQSVVDGRIPYFTDMLGEKPQNWLEIGPGSGLLSAVAARHGGTWRGCEIEPEMAEAMAARGLDVIHADFSSVDPQQLFTPAVADRGGFDIVFLSQVLEHVRSPARFLQNAYAALRPGGIIYIDVPNDGGLTGIVRRLNKAGSSYGEVVPPFHMIAYGQKTLHYALDHAGFDRIDVKTASYSDPVFGLAHARVHKSSKLKAVWALSGLVGLGGNLIAMAQRPPHDRAGKAASC